jgi:hypothetical protein
MSVQSAFSQNFPMPIGCVVTYLGENTPSSFLLCDGTTYNINEYPYLYNTLKDAYGGDGITTFSVPNLVGEFISGIAQNTNPPTYTIGGGSFTGNWSGTLASANLPSLPLDPFATGGGFISLSATFGLSRTDIIAHGSGAGHNYGSLDGGLGVINVCGQQDSGGNTYPATDAPQWSVSASDFVGDYTNGFQTGISGSVTGVGGVPAHYTLKYIIKAKP